MGELVEQAGRGICARGGAGRRGEKGRSGGEGAGGGKERVGREAERRGEGAG